jgi:flagellar motor switch protein FliG
MSGKKVVLTMYGRGDQIIDISVSLFDTERYYEKSDNAESYCENINRLNLQNDEWINAKVIQENRKIRIRKPDIQFDVIKKLKISEIFMILCDRSCSYSIFAIAIKGNAINETILKEYLNDPSLRTMHYGMYDFFKEYEKAGTPNEEDIIAARQKVVEVIKQLVAAGKIVIDGE